MFFSLVRLEFDYVARSPVALAEGKATNILRGALGLELRRLNCLPDCSDSRSCPRREPCLYQQLFEGETGATRPSGYQQPPRPFVLRSPDWSARTIQPGEHLIFALHLFDHRPETLDTLLQAASQFTGLGPGRATVELHQIRRAAEPLAIDLSPHAHAPTRVRARFTTPTEIKANGEITGHAAFEPLFARLYERIRFLLRTYPPSADAAAPALDPSLLDAARRVVTIQQSLRPFSVTRYSTRTGQSHPLAGFVGEASYDGDFTLLWPWLKASEWTGIGRQTVWGKGAVEWSPE